MEGMTAQDVYDEIKAFLKYVGLSFGEMNLVHVRAVPDELHLSYGRYTAIITMEKSDEIDG